MSYRRPSLPSVGDVQDAMHSMRAAYAADQPSRFRRHRPGLPGMGSGGDYHLGSEAVHLHRIEVARDVDRSDMVVGQAVTRLVDNLMQGGFQLDVATGSDDLDRILMERWSDWAGDPNQCDIAGEHDFATLTNMAVRADVVDGDTCSVGLSSGHLQAFEAHRLRTPNGTKRNVVLGVLLDEYRKRQEYWFTKDDIDPNMPLRRVNETVAYPVRDDSGLRLLFHLYDPRRVTLTRGVTKFAPIFDAAGMHDDVQFATLLRQQLVSCFAIIEESDSGAAAGNLPALGARGTQSRADGTTGIIEQIEPGMRIKAQPGHRIRMDSAKVPAAEFFPHTLLILQIIAINLDMPVQVLLLDPRQTNFSGWRGSIDQARTSWRSKQKRIIAKWHRPIYRWKVRQFLADDPALMRLANQSGVRWDGHTWNPSRWPYIQPVEDQQAMAMACASPIFSLRRVSARESVDFKDEVRDRIDDCTFAITAAKQAAQAINAQFKDDPNKVSWRELWNPPVNTELTAAAASTTTQQSTNSGGDSGDASGGNSDQEDDDA